MFIGVRRISILGKTPPCLAEFDRDIYCTLGIPTAFGREYPHRIDATAIYTRPSFLFTARRLWFLLQPPAFPENVSEQAKNFLSNCLIIDPDSRMKASELLQHAVSSVSLVCE